MANLRSIGQAMMIYVNENRGVLPYGFVSNNELLKPDGPPGFNYPGESSDWTTLLVSVMSRRGSGYNTGQQTVGTGAPGLRATFMCPTVAMEPSVESFITHYSAHPRILPDLATADWTTPLFTQTSLRSYKLARIKHATDMVVVFDATLSNPSGPAGQWIA